MEQELFFSGYCRVLDSSRSVIAVIEDGSLTEVDCHFENCIYASTCPIGQQIQKSLE